MPVVINPDSEIAKEQRKWEQFDRYGHDGTLYRAGNPYQYRAYPKMLYKAHVWPRSGQALCFAPPVSPYGWRDPSHHQQAVLEAEHFNTTCQRVVNDESEYRLAYGQGWADDPPSALARYEQDQHELGDLAANAAYQAQRMSDTAQREFQAAQDATHEHVADVATPKRRGRPPKATVTQE